MTGYDPGWHPRPVDRRRSVEWAQRVLASPAGYVILDTETTGLGPTAEVIQIAVVDTAGTPLLNTLVRPLHLRSMPPDAAAIHGITMKMLDGAPTWPEVAPGLLERTTGRIIVTYNAEYDSRLIKQTASRNGGAMPLAQWDCAMLEYARFRGVWDHSKGGYRWHRLCGGDHSALGDCLATLALIRQMAGRERARL